MLGRHTEESIQIRALQYEICDIKKSVADVLSRIRNINESNNYSDESVKRRKISELCTDTMYELLIDEIEDKQFAQKNRTIIPFKNK